MGPRVAILSLMGWSIVTAAARAAEPPNVVDEPFANRSYDRNVWRIDPTKHPQATFDLGEDGLAIRIPKGSTSGQPAEVKSRFKLDGDFNMLLDYSIDHLPSTAAESAKVEISLYGPAGSASFRRTQKSGEPGFAIWFQPAGENSKISYQFLPLGDVVEGRSQLHIVRTGPEIRFTARITPDQHATEIGTLQYSGAVTSVQFRMFGKPQEKPAEVRFHRIRLAADKLWYGKLEDEPPEHAAEAIAAVIAAALIAGMAAWLWRRSLRHA